LKKFLNIVFIFLFGLVGLPVNAQENMSKMEFSIYGVSFSAPISLCMNVSFDEELDPAALKAFHNKLNVANYQPLVDALQQFRAENQLNDWLYYQLIRKVAQNLSPKSDNYYRYTLYKWFLMVKSGFDATLNIYNDQLLFYVYSTEDVTDIPLYTKEGKQYVCLNIHDYIRGQRPFSDTVRYVKLSEPEAIQPFSYRVTHLPDFDNDSYSEKQVKFPFRNREYHFTLKVNAQLGALFANYPTVTFEDYFNIPLSRQTYQSLVPLLKKNTAGMKLNKGVEYLMKFTRNAFLYEDDQAHFGKEKRMCPELTLLSDASDCDDRAALFFYLVKEIYNLPMVALLYPEHITIAVLLDKPVGRTVEYNGNIYTLCEPTPQGENLGLGKMAPKFNQQPYQIAYSFMPKNYKQ
jgi:hypothetical protein